MCAAGIDTMIDAFPASNLVAGPALDAKVLLPWWRGASRALVTPAAVAVDGVASRVAFLVFFFMSMILNRCGRGGRHPAGGRRRERFQPTPGRSLTAITRRFR